jgi:hypothetical protein
MTELTDDITYALFASDLAQDVRSEFFTHRDNGMSVSDATGACIASFRHLLDRPDDGPTVIVALAVLQLRANVLDATFRDAALALLREDQAFRTDSSVARRKREQFRQQLIAILEAKS